MAFRRVLDRNFIPDRGDPDCITCSVCILTRLDDSLVRKSFGKIVKEGIVYHNVDQAEFYDLGIDSTPEIVVYMGFLE